MKAQQPLVRRSSFLSLPCASSAPQPFFQTTLTKSIRLSGVGGHSGQPCAVIIHPAEANQGIVFVSSAGGGAAIPAHWTRVAPRPLCTRLRAENATASISVVEHILACFSALNLDNALIEVEGPEIPILDGCAREIALALDDCGCARQKARRREIEILKPVRVCAGDSFAELAPSHERSFEVGVVFPHAAIGAQSCRFNLDAGDFRKEIAPARTFGFMRDAEDLWRKNLALGASFENTIILDEDGILNPGGARFSNEFARHKLLDAIGDLFLAGAPIRGAFRSFKGGHALNFALIAAIFADAGAWRYAPPKQDALFLAEGAASSNARQA